MKYILILAILVLPVFCPGQSRSLEDFIEMAKENNSTLKEFRNQILSNLLDSQILKATTRTQLNFASNEMYAPVIHGWGYDEAITNIAQVSAMLQATRTFLSKGYLSAQYRAIALQNQALRDSVLLSEKDLVRTISDQYITAYADQLTMENTRELYEELKKKSEVLKRLAESNVIKQTEFLAFDITVKQQELTWMQSQIQYNADYLTLNFLAGIVDTAVNQVTEPKLEDSLPHDFYNSAFYRRYITDSLRIINERRLLDYSYRPTFNSFTDAGFNSSLQNTPYKNLGFSLGVNIKMPIYDAHQKAMKGQKLDIEERTRIMKKNFFINQYNQQVAQLTIQLRFTNQLFEKIRQQLDYTRALIQAYEKLLETGDVKIIDFVTAITNYLNAQNSFRQNYINRLKIINQINYWSQ